MEFKYHNVLTEDGEWTVPGICPVKDTPTFQSISKQLLERYPMEKERREMTLLDVGSLEGGYAVLLSQLGFRVTMLEAREDSIRKCKKMADLCKLHIEMLEGDAKCILMQPRKWDIVICAGVLYHLDKPVDFLGLLSSCAKQEFIVSTHYSLANDSRYELPKVIKRFRRIIWKRIPELFKYAEHNLSELCFNEGYEGRWVKEYKEKATKEEIEKSVQAAFSNDQSFWLTLRSLLKIMTYAKRNYKVLRMEHIHRSICFSCFND